MKTCYVSLRKNPAGSPENKKISYPGKGTRFGKHLFITYLKIEYTLCYNLLVINIGGMDTSLKLSIQRHILSKLSQIELFRNYDHFLPSYFYPEK